MHSTGEKNFQTMPFISVQICRVDRENNRLNVIFNFFWKWGQTEHVKNDDDVSAYRKNTVYFVLV